jgi:hypothetical protein
MKMDRSTDYPMIDGVVDLPEIFYLTLPNKTQLGLRPTAFAAVVPVLHDPEGEIFHVEGGRVRVKKTTSNPGTAFSVFPQLGMFATAAHVLPENPEEAVARGEVGVALRMPTGQRSILKIKSVAIDDRRDVAICCADVSFSDFEYPYVPLALDREEIEASNVVLYSSGFPEPVETSEALHLTPTAYVGEGRAQRVNGPYPVTSRGRVIELSGSFILVDMDVRPGMSGGPLIAQQIQSTTKTDAHEVNYLRGNVVGVMSWRTIEVLGPTSTGKEGFFADIRGVLDLPLRVDGRTLTLRQLYDSTPKREPPPLRP